MSLIADALRKADAPSRGSQNSPRPPPGNAVWLYRALLAVIVVSVLGALTWLGRQPSSWTRRSTPQARPLSRIAAPPLPQGPALIQITRSQWALSGIVHGGKGKPLALIDNQVVEEGDTFKGAKIVRVDQAEVELEREGKRSTLRLPE